jgi:hypothetical protein
MSSREIKGLECVDLGPDAQQVFKTKILPSRTRLEHAKQQRSQRTGTGVQPSEQTVAARIVAEAADDDILRFFMMLKSSLRYALH